MIGIVTDSNSQLPADLAERSGIEVVPLMVTVDGEPHAEGVDLDADAFYALFDDGEPDVSTAAPSPGSFVTAYRRLVERGANEILSIHIGAGISGTLNSARLGADAVDVPVRLVDTGTASFGIAVCVIEASEVVAAGGSLDEAAAVAERMAPTVENVFTVRGLDLVRAGGRLAAGSTATEAVPVLSLIGDEIRVVDQVTDAADGVAAMVDYVMRDGGPRRVSVGHADAGTAQLAATLEEALRHEEGVEDVVRYRIGPSVGVHSGPGTVGCFFWPPGGG